MTLCAIFLQVFLRLWYRHFRLDHLPATRQPLSLDNVIWCSQHCLWDSFHAYIDSLSDEEKERYSSAIKIVLHEIDLRQHSLSNRKFFRNRALICYKQAYIKVHMPNDFERLRVELCNWYVYCLGGYQSWLTVTPIPGTGGKPHCYFNNLVKQ